MKTKEEIIRYLLEKGVLIDPDTLETITEDDLAKMVEKVSGTDALVLSRDHERISDSDINWKDFDNGVVQKEKNDSSEIYDRFMDYVGEEKPVEKPADSRGVKVVYTYDKESQKRYVQDFVAYYNKRYQKLQSIIMQRPELHNTTSIGRVLQKKDKENVAVIGMVNEKTTTKNGNMMITVEDPTGEIKVVVSKAKPDLFEQVKDIVEDEVIGVVGVNGSRIMFANNVIWPDVPISDEQKRSPDETYAVFLSDIHVGSNNFLPEEFERFLKWIRGEAGSEKQKDLASKIKYLFVVGDIVDGVGIYPGQEDELTIPDIYEQYSTAAELFKRVPEDINIIMCPGNHDAGRIAEPQLKMGAGFSKPLSEIPNVTLVSNPSLINIHASDGFPGFDVLMYHGYSFDHFVANVDSIRNKGGYDRADLIMRYLLQRRHLAPSHGSTLYIPDSEEDHSVISTIPDFFITGHIHKCSVASYRGVTLICGSCWQSMTSFQKKVGHHPEPARVPIVNLQTREIKIMRF